MIDSSVWSGLNVGTQMGGEHRDPEEQRSEDHRDPVKVMAALRDSGFRNAWMPFEIASTPLKATAPDENARSSKKEDAPVSSACRAGEVLQRLVVDRESTERAGRDPDQSDDDEQRHHHDVGVGRRREQPSRLAHATKVRDRNQCEQHETELEPRSPAGPSRPT